MTYELIDVFIITIPETFVTLLVVLQLLDRKLNLKKILVASVLQGFATFVIRQIHIYSLLHSILQIFMCILIVAYLFKIDFKLVFVALVITVVVYGFIEQLSIYLVLKVLHKTLSEVMNNQLWEFVVFVPQLLYMVIIYFILRRFNITITSA
ncbi:hypothetical protein SAMN02746089_01574 [Caldanaerobius fijiensis DSM 17918]|uniref:Uncharacterized protein n=1 Tax=Caldanaerobius fijiensis DSM 17918 TaxID=1121256 RepID=A0A1M5A8I6_9THEO|nr:hypothetical protein [Caldanaerobius fijiensis]SHF26182.1 hypothetical protein SAMN02746089_01574 [Caldanaerobius fijiensis DSM 17918]